MRPLIPGKETACQAPRPGLFGPLFFRYQTASDLEGENFFTGYHSAGTGLGKKGINLLKAELPPKTCQSEVK